MTAKLQILDHLGHALALTVGWVVFDDGLALRCYDGQRLPRNEKLR